MSREIILFIPSIEGGGVEKNLKHNIMKFNRKLDIRGYRADINQAKKKINWKAKINFKKIIFKMVNDELF